MILINKINLPYSIIEKTINFFRDLGQDSLEACVIWVGEEQHDLFEVRDVWFPRQENTIISYYIPAIEVHYFNVKLNKNNYSAIAQLHTHPGDAFHSTVDDEHTILSLPGSFSIVFPNFGSIPVNAIDKWVVYRLLDGQWKYQTKNKVKEVFQIIE
ncbi:MAG: hypothetical protein ACFE9R_01240 [Candidatus Hermodarchaeota archaeon]